MEEELLREKIINLATYHKGKSYEHGMHGPLSFDCAGFVWYVYDELLHINLYKDGYGRSTTTMMMTSNYGKITLFDENILNKDLSLIRQGDILFFHRQSLKEKEPSHNNKYPGHCGIYLGNNKFIHCTKKNNVHVTDLEEDEYWQKKLVASKDVISNYYK